MTSVAHHELVKGNGRIKRWVEMRDCERWDCTQCNQSYICEIDAGCLCGAPLRQVPGRWGMYNTGEWVRIS